MWILSFKPHIGVGLVMKQALLTFVPKQLEHPRTLKLNFSTKRTTSLVNVKAKVPHNSSMKTPQGQERI